MVVSRILSWQVGDPPRTVIYLPALRQDPDPGVVPWSRRDQKPESCRIRRSGRTGRPFSLLCLAPRGVCPAPSITLGAVSSYLAFSPLPPVHSRRNNQRRYVFCDTFRDPTITAGSPRFRGARCPVEFGLSSPTSQSQSERPSTIHSKESSASLSADANGKRINVWHTSPGIGSRLRSRRKWQKREGVCAGSCPESITLFRPNQIRRSRNR